MNWMLPLLYESVLLLAEWLVQRICTVRDICKLGDLAYFGEFAKLGENLSLNLENAS